ncbi:hypothetical protein [Myroides marinus]|uniref:hypothetical protein n=1 Tax=Myroides marinus TaxID=703342 RepID=UPI0025783E87|nr:hypothetical protein [Myroides marinus]MDM1378665.1 hypothetical protein [Myroides marinus]MDM1385936.1 hypothetical protein [Myroides marinus]MDM1393149.1 hypothetical protein [Myroides marinus]
MKKANQQVLHALLSGKELSHVLEDTKDTIPEGEMFNFLLKNNILFKVDANAAHLDSEAISFIVKRTNALGEELVLDEKKLDKKVSKAIKKDKIHSSEALAYMINQIRKKLPKNYTICNLERGDEAYYIGVIKKKELKKINKLSLDFGVFHKFSISEDQDPFYVIECSCGATYIWETQEEGENHNTGVCHNCGKSFSDLANDVTV